MGAASPLGPTEAGVADADAATTAPVARVTVNGRFLSRQSTGVDRFAAELLKAWLPRYGRARAVSLVTPRQTAPGLPEGFGTTPTPRGRLSGHLWEQIELPRFCRNEVLVSLCNTGPILYRRQLAVLHDAAVMTQPSSYSFAFRTWYNALFGALMRRCAVIATVSEFSAGELTRHVGARASNIEIIYESGEHVLRSESDRRIIDRLGLVDQKYVLAVGSKSLNKNFAGVMKAAEKLEDLGIKIVAAGGGNSRVFAGVTLRGDNVVLAGYVTDGELRALYENAECFVFPSFYEGFGLPPLEAMHCGCPVIVSRRASLPEVCGEAAIYCNPADPDDIAKCLRQVLTSKDLRDELRAAGLARAAGFTWQKSAQRMEEILVSHFDGARS